MSNTEKSLAERLAAAVKVHIQYDRDAQLLGTIVPDYLTTLAERVLVWAAWKAKAIGLDAEGDPLEVTDALVALIDTRTRTTGGGVDDLTAAAYINTVHADAIDLIDRICASARMIVREQLYAK